MNISPNEAEEALAAIQNMTHKTRQAIASSNAHISLIITGTIWLIGFVCTQFLSDSLLLTYIWIGLSVVGSLLAGVLNMRLGKRVRSPSAGATAKRIALVWLLLALYGLAAIALTWPIEGKQLTMFIVLFVILGWMAMGVLLSFSSIWPGLFIIALALVGYFLLPAYFYLWMGILVGGGLIAFGIYIRSRW
jgi:hypothetical protein